LPAKKNYEN